MGLRGLRHRNMTGAIIPALMHQIRSELPVKPAWVRIVLGWVTFWAVLVLHPSFWVFLGLTGYHSGLPLVVPMGTTFPIGIGTVRSSIRAPDRKIRVVIIARLRFFPIFYHMEDPIVCGRSAETISFLDGRGESYGWKRLVEGMGLVGDR